MTGSNNLNYGTVNHSNIGNSNIEMTNNGMWC